MQRGSEQLSEVKKACYKQQIYYLQHKTRIEYLPAIFNSGKLSPRSEQDTPRVHLGGSGDVVYLQPYKLRQTEESTVKELSGDEYGFELDEESGKLSNAILWFSVQILADSNDYFGNSGWGYGLKDSTSHSAEEIKAHAYAAIDSHGELCFPHSISLADYLVSTWVHPLKENQTLELLKKNDIDISKFPLSTYSYHPEITLTNLTPEIVNRNYLDQNVTVVITSNIYTFFEKNSKEKIQNKLMSKYELSDFNQSSIEKGLRKAAVNNQLGDLKLFITFTTNINAQDSNPTFKRTALHWAAIKGNKECYLALIDNGAKINIMDATGKTARDYLLQSRAKPS